MPKYQLEIDEKHASVLVDALDLFTRINLGQFSEVIDMWKEKAFGPIRHNLEDQVLEAAEHHMKRVKKLLTGHDYNSSFGIGSPVVGKSGHIAYELGKIIRHQRWLDRRNPTTGDGWSVDSSEDCLHYSGHPLATIRKVE